jgi:hypothetical protein
MMRGLHVTRIELDEAWSFVAKKQRHLKPGDWRSLAPTKRSSPIVLESGQEIIAAPFF